MIDWGMRNIVWFDHLPGWVALTGLRSIFMFLDVPGDAQGAKCLHEEIRGATLESLFVGNGYCKGGICTFSLNFQMKKKLFNKYLLRCSGRGFNIERYSVTDIRFLSAPPPSQLWFIMKIEWTSKKWNRVLNYKHVWWFHLFNSLTILLWSTDNEI